MLGTASAFLAADSTRIIRIERAYAPEILVQQERADSAMAASQQAPPGHVPDALHESVLKSRGGVCVSDTSMDARWSGDRNSSRGIVSYLGFPIAEPDGELFGILEASDRVARNFSATQVALLEQTRDSIEDQLALIVLQEQRSRLAASVQVERERLVLATRATGSGVWDYNIERDELYCDAKWHEIVGHDPGRPVSSIADFKPHIHPEDVDRATDVHAALSELIENQHDYHNTFRIVRPDGEIRWVQSSACVVAAGSDTPNRAVGAIVDITSQTLAAAALAESEQRFKTLAEMLPQNVFSARADGAIDYHNRRWYEFTGLEPGSFDSMWWTTLLHPEDIERTIQAWRHAVATGDRFEVETRCLHHSGEYRWLHAVALPLLDANGRVAQWFGTATDIHDSKLLERNRELLTRELDHRIRNLFAVVGGLVTLSARDDPSAAAFAAQLKRRLCALHRAHALAVAPGAGAVCRSLQDLIRILLEPYRSESKARIVIGGDDVQLDASVIATLALIFHELATNASKYGALGVCDGGLTITLAAGEDQLRVAWTERLASNARRVSDREGFGSKLLSLLLKEQLHGEISSRWTEHSLSIELCLPLRMICQPAG